MTTIRSNPWGFRIHSPFAYKMVAKVIFGNEIYVKNSTDIPVLIKRKERKRINRLLRVIHFLNPGTIVIVEENIRLTNMMESICLDRKILKKSNSDMVDYISEAEFVIWNHAPESMPEFAKLPAGPATWVIYDLKCPKMKNFLAFMRNSGAVSLTFEAGNSGYVIFNQKFHKQDYVIRCCF